MIRIIDTYADISWLFDNGNFNMETWKIYINQIYTNSAELFLSDMQECLDNGKYSYEKVEAANESYGEALMDYYMVQLNQMIIELKDHATLVCADSKKSSSIFWEKEADNNYWYYKAKNEIANKYNDFSASDFLPADRLRLHSGSGVPGGGAALQ